MTDHKDVQSRTHAKKYKSIIFLRMIGIVVYGRVFVIESCLCLFEGNTMFFYIGSILLIIPDKKKIVHMYNVRIIRFFVKVFTVTHGY